jgi:hypothetical protein
VIHEGWNVILNSMIWDRCQSFRVRLVIVAKIEANVLGVTENWCMNLITRPRPPQLKYA